MTSIIVCNIITAEMTTALKTLKAGKAPGPDDIHPEYIIHLHERVIQWLRIFISVCLSTQTIPKMWRRAKVIVVGEVSNMIVHFVRKAPNLAH